MTRLLFAAALTLAVLGGSASASPIVTIDQQNNVGATTNFPSAQAVGQSFTPTLNRIDAAEFLFQASGATLQLSLYDGSGIGGALLGQSAAIAVTTMGFETVHFDLLTPVALTPGNVYTLFVRNSTGQFGQQFSTSNPYPGGIAFDAGGTGFSAIDLRFAEGLHAAAIPEPGTMAVFGLLALGGLAVRRRKASSGVA